MTTQTRYRNMPLTEMTREELIDALGVIGKLYAELIESHIKEHQFMRELRND